MFHLRQHTHTNTNTQNGHLENRCIWINHNTTSCCTPCTAATRCWDKRRHTCVSPCDICPSELREQPIMSFQEYNSENIPICNAHPDWKTVCFPKVLLPPPLQLVRSSACVTCFLHIHNVHQSSSTHHRSLYLPSSHKPPLSPFQKPGW